MPIAGSIESKIANWPAVSPPILRGAARRAQRGDGVHRTRGIIHDAARAEALRRELVEAHLRGDSAHARKHTATAAGSRLIHQREERVGRVGADGRGDAGDETGPTGNAELLARRHLRGLGAQAAVDSVGNFILHNELRDGVPVHRLIGNDRL